MKKLLLLIAIFSVFYTHAQDMVKNEAGDSTKSTHTIICQSSIVNNDKPLYVINGILLTSENSNFISQSDIEKLDVFKGSQATALYGTRGANGVILIKLKDKSVYGKAQLLKQYKIAKKHEQLPIYYDDTKLQSGQFFISASKIASVKVLKDNFAKENGALYIQITPKP
jgi:TonB-dependent SusC/RagA subfamily outer membrane receptor